MKQIIYVFLLTVLSSCDSYLSKVPSPSTSAPINNVEQLVAIYDNATAFINETNPFACYSNDDADLTAELYKADPSAFAISSTVFYNILHTAGIASQASDGLWNGEYSNIFKANTIINNVDKVTGDESEKIKLKCNAHFLRAYSYFVLAQYYCLPYCEANKNALGLPKRLNTDFEESIARVSLDEIYQLILDDLEIAANVIQLRNAVSDILQEAYEDTLAEIESERANLTYSDVVDSVGGHVSYNAFQLISMYCAYQGEDDYTKISLTDLSEQVQAH